LPAFGGNPKQDECVWNDIAGGSDWHWDVAHSSEDGNQTVYFTLSPGTHTLEWGYREDGLFLDAIQISNVVE
jgi:hypothetical protein